jgi:hypothetical protein
MFLPGVLFLILSLKASWRLVILWLLLPAATFETSLWFYVDEGRALARVAWGRPALLLTDAALLFSYLTLAWAGLTRSAILCGTDETAVAPLAPAGLVSRSA